MIDRRLLKDFDWLLLALTLALAAAGAVGVYSATHAGEGPSPLYYDHLGRLAVGFAAMLVVLAVDYHTVLHYAYHFYGVCLLALLAVDLFGMVGMGAQRWLRLGVVSVQPSEFFKVALVLMLARFFSDLERPPPYGPKDIWPPTAATLAAFLLVMKQPDLGTALIIAGIFVLMLFAAGVELRLFAWLAAAGSALVATLAALHVLGVFSVLNVLKEYQLRRVRVLLNPNLDPLGAGYHITQSKIAIGSGGLTGKGFLGGTQSGLNFLPQQHTDFIFSVISEEWGFLGSAAVIVLMLLLLLRALQAARRAKDLTGGLVVVGVATVLFLHMSINIGMTTGVVPVVGLPLPLLSYGGSSVLTTFAGIGLILNVSMRRFLYG